MNETTSKTILIGVCGGIAAYKTVEVVSRLRQMGHVIHVAMSEAACQFVTPLTFAAISGNRVLTHSFPDAEQESGDALYPHLYPATQADVFLLMPATADMLGRVAQGLGNEIISMCALSLPASCRRILCPSMNVEMWEQDAVQASIRILEDRGWIRLGPGSGALACGMEGAGRMAEPADVLDYLAQGFAKAQALTGKTVLILSGPTHEHLDPVRYIGNASSGRMGKALAETAADRGAHVLFVTGPVSNDQLPRREAVDLIRVISAADMLEAATSLFPRAELIVFAAAVADYRPATRLEEKREKPSAAWALDLTPTPDIAATLSAQKRPDQRSIGFALQTGDGLQAAQGKLERKQLDAIVLNHPDSMGASSGTFTWITKEQPPQEWGALSKRDGAIKIIDGATVWFT